MTRVSFELMPTDGPRDNRQTSRVINQAMTGKANCVRDYSIDQTGLQAGTITLTDPRISSQSYISLMPMNVAALVALDEILLGNPIKGSVDIGAINPALQEAFGTAQETGALQLIGTTAEPLWLADTPPTGTQEKNMAIEVQGGPATYLETTSLNQFNVSFSGSCQVDGNAGDISVGFLVDQDGTGTLIVPIVVRLGRITNASFIQWSTSAVISMEPGGKVFPAMAFTNAQTISDKDYILSASSLGGNAGLPIDIDPDDDLGLGFNGPLEYRMLIIG